MHTPPPNLPHVVAAAVVDNLDSPTQLLAARRSTPVELAGQWEFPGGKIEPGESPQEALDRELDEELRLRITRGSLVVPSYGTDWMLTDALTMRVWLVTSSDQPRLRGSHDELRWLRLDLHRNLSPTHPLLSVPWLKPDLPIIEALHRQLKAHRDPDSA